MNSIVARLVLFAGPTAHGLQRKALLRRGELLQPPVRRGDIARLVRRTKQPGVVVICDGVFGGEPAVSHNEICNALDAGWQVWGVSSIGAIRAWELRTEGMRGHGYVYEQFARFEDFTDDELCLLHFPEPPYFPVSEPLVNLRYALDMQGAALGITNRAAQRLIEALRELWFGDRTEARMHDLMTREAGIAAPAAQALLAWMRLHRVKTLDLLSLMTARPWA
jgi:hypothetical protein